LPGIAEATPSTCQWRRDDDKRERALQRKVIRGGKRGSEIAGRQQMLLVKAVV
jgi:hypothetical protein